MLVTLHSPELNHEIWPQNVKLMVNQNNTSTISMHWQRDIHKPQCMLSFLPTLLPWSHSLLMQIPTRRTFGFTLLVQIMKYNILSFSLMEFAAPAYCENETISVQRWAPAVHIWNNPPAPLESGSIQGTQPCFNWPMSKQLTSRIMHHFLRLSK